MIALVQRVAGARVEVEGAVVGQIGRGLLVFVCAEPRDEAAHADRLVDKLLKLRVFSDEAGKMNRDVRHLGAPGAAAEPGGLLIVSQFTLAADTSRGNRPSFTGAAPADHGRRLYERVLAQARLNHAMVAAGSFGADMQVHLVNDGPVTLPIRL
jgi:D-tyrosyl-tRNA(Tyr) deacylase